MNECEILRIWREDIFDSHATYPRFFLGVALFARSFSFFPSSFFLSFRSHPSLLSFFPRAIAVTYLQWERKCIRRHSISPPRIFPVCVTLSCCISSSALILNGELIIAASRSINFFQGLFSFFSRGIDRIKFSHSPFDSLFLHLGS